VSESRNSGRSIGVLILLQMIAGLILSFVLIDAVRAGYPSFLETAAASRTTVRAGVAVATLGAALTLAVGLSMFRIIEGRSRTLAILFLCLCGISAALDLVHNSTVLSMLSAAEQYAAAGGAAGPNGALYSAWGIAAASMRRSAHIMQLVGIAAWIFTFYLSLGRFRLVPRPLVALGLLGICSQLVGVTLMMFLGNSPITYLAVPLAPIHVLTAVWIMVKGLRNDVAIVEL
jgi:hypothetical protein